jgi:hypothetical protein
MATNVDRSRVIVIGLPHRPFFIVGHPRSGTTLLRFLLSSHPRLYVPEETGFIPFLVREDRLNAELSLDQVRRIVQRIGRLNRLWHGMVDDLPAFYQALPEPHLAHVLDALYRQQLERYGAVRWGDKTPLYIRYIPLLDELFPTAQFVHLIRDGRDATLSALKKWPERHLYMDHFYLLRNWVTNVNAGREAGRTLGPDRYLELRYEALVQQPQQALEQICAFLGESFHPAMLDHTRLAARVGPGPQGHVEVQEPISTRSVDRWKMDMTAFHLKMANRIAGGTLADLGYERAPVGPFSPAEKARFYLLAARYQLARSLRSALYASGILTLNRDMRR